MSPLFELTTAMHHLIIRGLPLRWPETAQAIAGFLRTARASVVSIPTLESLLIRTLAVFDQDAGPARLPSLVDRYIAITRTDLTREGLLAGFRATLENLLRFRGLGHPAVTSAVEVIDRHYSNPALTPAAVAEAVGPEAADHLVRSF